MKLSEQPTKAPSEADKDKYKEQTKALKERLGELQNLLYAGKEHALLVILQGMDASGKDSTTRNVFEKCYPMGFHCSTFIKPTELEFSHDFLWRIHQVVPAKGNIAVFNRSHYEEVLIQKVHKWVSEEVIEMRYRAINMFEELLTVDSKTVIVKCMLHMSKEKQKEELQERIDNPEKNWKYNDGDWQERKCWDEYMVAYQEAISKCNYIPWNIIPADNAWYRDYSVTKLLVQALEKLNMKYPKLTKT